MPSFRDTFATMAPKEKMLLSSVPRLKSELIAKSDESVLLAESNDQFQSLKGETGLAEPRDWRPRQANHSGGRKKKHLVVRGTSKNTP